MMMMTTRSNTNNNNKRASDYGRSNCLLYWTFFLKNFWMMMNLARKRSLLCVAMATRLADRVCQQQQRGVMY
jgi:hypothetical protein